MNMARLVLVSAFAAPLLLLASGCTVARKQETVGEYIDGTTITTTVKARLANDPETSALSIKVTTIDAGIVQLSGFARSNREKTRAGEIALSVKGVTNVHNDLIVKP